MKPRMKQIAALLLAAAMLVPLSGNAFALNWPAAAPNGEGRTAWSEWKLPASEESLDGVMKVLEQLARGHYEFLLGQAEKLRAMDAEALNAYIDAMAASIRSGSFSGQEELSGYVKDYLAGKGAADFLKSDEARKLLEAMAKASGKEAPAEGAELTDSQRSALLSTWLGLKLAWLAAAQLARLLGYPCAATLVECSVLGLNYVETNGLFRNRIMKTRTYQSFAAQVKSGEKQLDRGYVLSHELKENRDLFFALHSCTYTVKKLGRQYVTTVTDIFDFAQEVESDSAFVSGINSWGWLNANMGVLREISITIYMI